MRAWHSQLCRSCCVALLAQCFLTFWYSREFIEISELRLLLSVFGILELVRLNQLTRSEGLTDTIHDDVSTHQSKGLDSRADVTSPLTCLSCRDL